jgi:hypothetical protein
VIEVGIDWAEDHHDVAVLDEQGRLLASRRIPEGVEGWPGCTPCWPTMLRTQGRSWSGSRPTVACWSGRW